MRSLVALGALSFVVTLALATPPPFDFSGTWTGTVTAPVGINAVGDLNATFTSTGPRTFTGSLTVPRMDAPPADWLTCTVRGKYGKLVKLRGNCEIGRAHV